MIRRQVGQEYWLITQDDHARIAGDLGRRLSDPPSCPAAIAAMTMHDSGWPMHDDLPTLNSGNRPLDVFETPPTIGLRVWDASVRRAVDTDPYAGLLVSLHALSLSVYATGSSPLSGNLWSLSDPRTRFDVNRFQHGMIELLESLRKQLGMRTDLPLKHGLVENPTDPSELKLTRDFRLLQGMDMISLSLCCTKAPFAAIDPMRLSATRPSADILQLNPWPFTGETVEVKIPFRRVSAEPFADEATFRAAYAAARVEHFDVSIRPFTI